MNGKTTFSLGHICWFCLKEKLSYTKVTCFALCVKSTLVPSFTFEQPQALKKEKHRTPPFNLCVPPMYFSMPCQSQSLELAWENRNVK